MTPRSSGHTTHKITTKQHANLQGTIVDYLYHRKTVNLNFKFCNLANNSLQKGSHFVIEANHSYLQDSTVYRHRMVKEKH